MIQIIGDATPSTPEHFQRRLQQFDRDLIVCWHKSPYTRQPGRWKIERCVRHHSGRFENGRPLHDHTCERTYILMCQDEEATPLPLGDWLFIKLGEMRARWEDLGGDTERGVRNAIAESNHVEQAQAAKRQADETDMLRYNRKDKRVQINNLMTLIERHDVRPN